MWVFNEHVGQDERGGHVPSGMYRELWTNGPKEAMEFSDYTYDDHFKTQLPVYLPRKLVYEYIMARVTQHGDIFEDVWFNTYV